MKGVVFDAEEKWTPGSVAAGTCSKVNYRWPSITYTCITAGLPLNTLVTFLYSLVQLQANILYLNPNKLTTKLQLHKEIRDSPK